MQNDFQLLARDPRSEARRGRLKTAHGVIDTPAFMPVGTQGSVKGVSPRELRELNAQIILGTDICAALVIRSVARCSGKIGRLHCA